MEWSLEQINQVEEKMNEKANVDKAFRTLCLENPNRAVKEIIGEATPSAFKLQLIESEGAYMVNILTDCVDPGSELEETAIEEIAGGIEESIRIRCRNCGCYNTSGYNIENKCNHCDGDLL